MALIGNEVKEKTRSHIPVTTLHRAPLPIFWEPVTWSLNLVFLGVQLKILLPPSPLSWPLAFFSYSEPLTHFFLVFLLYSPLTGSIPVLFIDTCTFPDFLPPALSCFLSHPEPPIFACFHLLRFSSQLYRSPLIGAFPPPGPGDV